MATYKLDVDHPLPYFAELPYAIWGEVNYDSDGDCASPTDRSWSWMTLAHRETGERLDLEMTDSGLQIEGPDPSAARLARFIELRSEGRLATPLPGDALSGWNLPMALVRAGRVSATFARAELAPFDAGHLFWGSWKWIGYFGTGFTWVGRWIMDAVLRGDTRAVHLCVSWLEQGTVDEAQSAALRYALGRFTQESFESDQEWLDWYAAEGEERFPEPDLKAWYAELKSFHG